MKREIQRFWLAAVVSSAFVLGLAWSSPAKAAPPEEGPATTLINGAGATGAPIADQLRSILQGQERIEYVKSTELLEAGRRHGVRVETLRKGSMRETHAEEFQKTMRESEVEIIFVLDVFSGKAQLVSIGPEGLERGDVRRPHEGRKLSEANAAQILEASFREVLPTWKSWRQSKSQNPEASNDTGSENSSQTMNVASGAGSADSSAGERSKGQDGGEPHAARTDRSAGSAVGASIASGVKAQVGLVAGRHRLNVTTPSGSGYNIQQANPFVGGTLELDATLGRFADNKAGFGVELFGTYAPFKTARREAGAPKGQTAQYSSSLSKLGLDFTYMRQLTNTLQVRAGTGFEALSLRVEKNREYTGNRYAQFRFTGGVVFQPAELFRAHVGGGLAPLLKGDMSGGAFGESTFAPGVLGESNLELRIFDAASVSLGYELYYYDIVFRSPKVIQTRAEVADTYHLGSLRVNYAF